MAIVMERKRYLRFLICATILFLSQETLHLITKVEDTLGEIMPFRNLSENLMKTNKQTRKCFVNQLWC